MLLKRYANKVFARDVRQTGMASYYDRYQRGEHEAVWSELLALGSAVHTESVRSDALAVARETMRRARANIETLIVRLQGMGYKFETARDTSSEFVQQLAELQKTMSQQLEAQFPGMLEGFANNKVFDDLLAGFDKSKAPASILEERSVYSPAQEWSAERVAALERYMQVPMPLSLRAWFETFQHVSFLGTHPVLNPANPQKGAVLPDAFTVGPLPDEVDFESWDSAEGYPIAVDEFFKAGLSREFRYNVDFKDSRGLS